MNQKKPSKILILCTGNSARSIIGEYLLRAKGRGRFEVHSAGSKPTGRVNPLAIRVLAEKYGLDASAGRSKSWDEFKGEKFDFVITVCDNARESCPVLPGHPAFAHWGMPDPAAMTDADDRARAFRDTYQVLSRRIDLLLAIPLDKLEHRAMEGKSEKA